MLSLSAYSASDKEMKDLIQKYDQVMEQKKTELVDEVFTQRFLRNSGGKKEFIEKVKELPSPTKEEKDLKVTWKKGVKDKIYFAKLVGPQDKKSKKEASHTEFIVVEENGKLKIDGQVGDAQ